MPLPENIIITRNVVFNPEALREELSLRAGVPITRVTDEQVIAELTYLANSRFRTNLHDGVIWTDEKDEELNPYTGKPIVEIPAEVEED